MEGFFKIISKGAKGNLARTGIISTRRGDIETPVFMPVGTAGSVKAVTPGILIETGASIILGNTYHLFLRPGTEIIKKFGSLHKFIGWGRPILTDSGGFQIFSLKGNSKVDDEGVRFKSHIDGSTFFLTPESVVNIQNVLDSDIQMVLDNFASLPASDNENLRAVELTSAWASRARKRFLESKSPNAQFGIIQGGLNRKLRRVSLEALKELDFEGYAVGGLSVGESRDEFEEMVDFIVPEMVWDKPRYLMGSGTPEEIIFAVSRGIDMFDCVMPTRNARNGTLFTWSGKISIKNSKFKDDKKPISGECGCYSCRKFSRAYLRHLFVSGEITASILNTIHNLFFYLDFMSQIRYSIKSGKFEEFKSNFLKKYFEGE